MMNKKMPVSDDLLDLSIKKTPVKNTAREEKEENSQSVYRDQDETPRTVKNKWLEYGKFFLYLLIFLVPLFFLPLTIVPLEINKIFLTTILILSAFICYLINIILTRKIIFPSSKLVLAVFVFIAAVFLSYFFSQNKSVGFYGNLIQSDSLLSFVLGALSFFLASVFFKRDNFTKIGLVFLSSLSLISVIGGLQLAGIFIFPFDFARQISFNTIGSFFSYAVFISFGLLVIIAAISELKLSSIARRSLAILALFIIAQLIVLNYSIIWLEIAIGTLLFIAYKFTFAQENTFGGEDSQVNKKYFGNSSVVVGVMIISFFLYLISSSLPQMVKIPIQVKPDISLTLNVAKETLKGKQLLFGSGPSTFVYNFTLFRPAELNQTNYWSYKFNQGFSFLTTSLATIGVLGVLAFFAIIIFFGLFAVKNLRDKKILIITVGLLFLFAELFLNEAFFIQLIFIFTGLGLMLAFSPSQKEISLKNLSKARLFVSFITIILLIISTLGLFYFTGRKYIAAVYYGQAAKESDYDKILGKLDKAMFFDVESNQYLRDMSQLVLLDIDNQKAKEKNSSVSSEEINNTIQSEIALAVQLAQRATVIDPNESLNWINLADIYEKIMPIVGGANLFAEKNYQEAIQRDPKNPYLQTSAARVSIATADLLKTQSTKDKNTEDEQKQKLSEAQKYLEKAIELKPDYAPAHYQVAMIYIRQGNIKDAISKLEETVNFAPYDSTLAFQLGSLYYNNNQMGKAQSELERAVSLNDNYSDARYILGLIYDKNGKKGKAIDQFKKILSANQDSELIKKILKNLAEDKNALDGLSSDENLESKDLPIDNNQ